MKYFKFREEKGAALLITMIILILVTIIGLAAISFSTFNIEIAGIKLKNTQNFYLGESFALETTSVIDTIDESQLELVKIVANEAGNEVSNNGLEWVYRKKDILALTDETIDPKFLTDEDIKSLFQNDKIVFKETSNVISDPNIKTKAVAIYNGVANEGSQDIGKGDALRDYIIFAQIEKYNGSIKTGEKVFEICVRRKF